MEVSDCELVAREVSPAMGLQIFVKKGKVSCQGGNIGFLVVIVKLPHAKHGSEFNKIVVGEVNQGISVPGLVGIGGVVAKVLTEVAQDGDRLVKLIAVVGEYG